MYIAPAISMLQVGSSLEVEGETTDREKDNSTEVEQNIFFVPVIYHVWLYL